MRRAVNAVDQETHVCLCGQGNMPGVSAVVQMVPKAVGNELRLLHGFVDLDLD